MEREIVIIVDDDTRVLESISYQFEDDPLGMELICCGSIREYQHTINDFDVKKSLKAIIFDLSIDKYEENVSKYNIDTYIKEQFHNNRIPIFIHSAFTETYPLFDKMGTVFKIPKKQDSSKLIHSKIKLLKESGFLNIFCPNGELDKKIMSEIHTAFVQQFKQNEIEEIIKSIQSAYDKDNLVKRTTEVFERLSLRSVYQNWMNAKSLDDGKTLEEVKVNAIEHYYRRNNLFEFWTGDIFIEKNTNQMVIILTPRCNLGHKNYDELMLCKIREIGDHELQQFQNTKIIDKDTNETKGQKTLRSSITDDSNAPLPGERFRFLPTTPQFKGGFVDFKTVHSSDDQNIRDNFFYLISLVDDLTNDVVRKLSAYLLRGGISETEYKEAHYYVNAVRT